MAIYQSTKTGGLIGAIQAETTPVSLDKTQIPTYTVATVYLLYLGFTLTTVKNAGTEGEMGGVGELVRILTLGPAYLLAAIISAKQFKTTLSILSRCWFYLIFLAYSALSAFWSQVPSKVLLNAAHDTGHFVVAITWLMLIKDRGLGFLLRHLSYAMLALILLSIAVSIAYPAIGVHPSLNRWQGLTGNPNTLGMFCVANIWTLLLLREFAVTFFQKTLCLIAMTVPLAALIGPPGHITSVASLGIATSLIMILPAIKYVSQGQATTRAMKTALVCFLALIGLLGACAFLPELFDLDYLLGKMGRDRSMSGRTKIWDLGWHVYSMKPWLGWSYDGLLSVMRALHFDITQFHNGYLDLMIRGGLIGLLILAGIILTTLWQLLKLIGNNPVIGWSLMAFSAALLLHNVAEASIMRPTNLYWFIFVLVYMIACNHRWLFPQEKNS